MTGGKICCLVAIAVAFSVRAEIRGVQLDLARQMEPVSFISNYIDRVAALGVNTLQLYLEGRVATRSFTLPAGECYTAEEMRGLVAHAAEREVAVVPVVSFLGHAEHFFSRPGLDDLSEESRGGATFGGSRKSTFCLSNPKTLEFIDRYVGELAEIFPGRDFHAGFDESWNTGRCPDCAAKAAKDAGDSLFAECILAVHGILAKHGRRMWMWDDFFAFHRAALERTPRDIMLLHWNYSGNISSRGARDNFGGHERRDYLADYARLGFEALTVDWSNADNITSLADYARKHRTAGFVVGQWEEFFRFTASSLPRVRARVLLAENPGRELCGDPFRAAAAELLPSLSPVEIDAVTEILHSSPPVTAPYCVDAAVGRGLRRAVRFGDRLAVETLAKSALAPRAGEVVDDPLSERAIVDDLVQTARTGLLSDEAIAIASLLTDPMRTAADVAAAKARAAEMRKVAVEVRDRRLVQHAKWRTGVKGRIDRGAGDFVQFADRVARLPDGPAPKDEKRLELCLTLVDFYGRPQWKVEGLFAGEWRRIALGGWKPKHGEWAAFGQYVTFKSETMPERIRLTYTGMGPASLRYLQVEDREGVVRPRAVVSAEGPVSGASNLLVDDTSEAVFGSFDAMYRIRNPRSEPRPAVVELELGGSRVHK